MGRTGPPGLAEQLAELKQRSGRSYAALAHRTGLSRSTLHRYCQGGTVPSSFGAVELTARACGADKAELDRLYRAWRTAVAEQEPVREPDAPVREPVRETARETAREESAHGPAHDPGREPSRDSAHATGSGGYEGDSGAPVPVPADRPAPFPLLLRTSHWLRAAALLFAFTLTSMVGVTSYTGSWSSPVMADGTDGGPPEEPAGGRQQFRGPLWSIAPRPLTPEFMGLTLNTDTGLMPGFRTGAVRLWNSSTRWGTIEGERREYDWSILDRMVKGAEREELPVLFTFGGTPKWAAPDGRKSFFRDALASPPDDLDDWDRFVEKVAERYRGRIEAYELWDYPSHKSMYTGTMATLGEMVERAARIIHRVDTDAKVVCPSFGHLWSGKGRALLREFARTGAYESCDAAALKMPPRKPAGPPEETIRLAREVHYLLIEEGQGDVPLWNTGPDWDVDLADPLDARRARDYAVRFYLSGFFARYYGMRRMYFYSWGSTGVPLVVQPVGGRPTEAGRRMGRLARWLGDARIGSCGEGPRSGLARGAYTCRFERDGRPLVVYWTTRGRGEVTLEKGASGLRRMDGSTERAREGDRLGFGEEPVLVEHRAP